MIDNERIKQLSEDELEQIADFSHEFDCFGRECNQCPFELDEPYQREGHYISYRCSLSYAKELYRRFTE